MRRVTHHLNLRDGSVTVSGSHEAYRVSWVPLRRDHPDAPQLIVSRRDADVETVLTWARDFFDGRDSRDLIEVVIESEASAVETEELSRLLDDAGTAAIVRACLERKSADPLPWMVIIKAPLAV